MEQGLAQALTFNGHSERNGCRQLPVEPSLAQVCFWAVKPCWGALGPKWKLGLVECDLTQFGVEITLIEDIWH